MLASYAAHSSVIRPHQGRSVQFFSLQIPCAKITWHRFLFFISLALPIAGPHATRCARALQYRFGVVYFLLTRRWPSILRSPSWTSWWSSWTTAIEIGDCTLCAVSAWLVSSACFLCLFMFLLYRAETVGCWCEITFYIYSFRANLKLNAM